jgi:hypothetical protein
MCFEEAKRFTEAKVELAVLVQFAARVMQVQST